MNVSLNDNIVSDATAPVVRPEFAFHWTDTSARDEIVRLTNRRLKIGSSADCDITLTNPQGRPLQCLVVQGPRGVLARNWQADASLNGKQFTEALLSPGDQLTFGDSRLDFVEQSQSTANNPIDPPAASANVKKESATAQVLEEAALQIQQLNQSLIEARGDASSNREQLKALLTEVNELRHASQQQGNDSASTAADESEMLALREKQVELEAFQKELQEASDNLRTEREQVETVLRAERDRLIAEAENLEAEKANLAQTEASNKNEAVGTDDRHDQHNTQAEQLAEREKQLEEAIAREQAELDAQRERLEKMQADLASEREQARAEIEQERQRAQDEIAAMRASATHITVDLKEDSYGTASQPTEPSDDASLESVDANEPLETAEAVIERMRAAGFYTETEETEDTDDRTGEVEIAEAASEEPAKPSLGDAAPVSFIDKYRDSFADELDDEAEAEAESLYPPPATEDTSIPEPFEQDEVPNEDGDDSIEDYMARLMQRVQGGPTGDAPPKPKPAPKAAAPAAPAPVQPAPQPAAAEPDAVMDASEFKPRSAAPEMNSNMAAMRDLANQSARSAISTSTKKVRWAFAGARFGMALFFFSIGSVMFLMKDSFLSPMFFGALVTFVGGAVLCYQGAQILAGKSPQATAKSAPAKSEPANQFDEE